MTQDPNASFTSSNGGQVFVPITNKDVWLKLIDLETKVDSLSIKIYASWAAAIIIVGFISLQGGLNVGPVGG